MSKLIEQVCEHDDCVLEAVEGDYCAAHHEHYFCECGTRLEDAAGTPGDGFCARCR